VFAVHIGQEARIEIVAGPAAGGSTGAELLKSKVGAAKVPLPVACDTHTPSWPKPTMSALPSPVTGNWCYSAGEAA